MDRIETLQNHVERDPENPTARYMLANELAHAARWQEVLDTLASYLAMHDDQGAAYRMQAKARLALGDVEGARESYRQGAAAARRHGHPTMAAEYDASLEDLADEAL